MFFDALPGSARSSVINGRSAAFGYVKKLLKVKRFCLAFYLLNRNISSQECDATIKDQGFTVGFKIFYPLICGQIFLMKQKLFLGVVFVSE